jgi:hypothetical protein
MRAQPTDNVGVDRVEFDIEPFGEREGLPYTDSDPPYEWYCDVTEEDVFSLDGSMFQIGTNVMVRAQVFDEAGQTWIHEVWVYISNWDDADLLINSCLFAVGIPDEVVDSTEHPIKQKSVLQGWRFLEDISWDFSNGYSVTYNSWRFHQFQGRQQGYARSFIGFYTNRFIIGIAGPITVQ